MTKETLALDTHRQSEIWRMGHVRAHPPTPCGGPPAPSPLNDSLSWIGFWVSRSSGSGGPLAGLSPIDSIKTLFVIACIRRYQYTLLHASPEACCGYIIVISATSNYLYRPTTDGQEPGVGAPTRHKVVISRNLGPDVMPLLTQRSDLEIVLWPENRVCDRKWLLENIAGATGVLVMLSEKIDAEFLDAAGPNIRVVSTMSVGYEHADLKELAKRGVRFGYTPDVLTDAVADLSWPNFTWSPFSFCGPQLSATSTHPSRTAGFIGFGRIAQATLARLVPFGFTHCLYTGNPSIAPDPAFDAEIAAKYNVREVRRVSLDELARESDVVFVLAPGGPSTYHIVDEKFLKGMKRTGVLVNTSRGTLVDSDALTKALREGWLWGAGLDVVEGEPNVTADHPLVKEPRCIVLPHIGSATTETRIGMATLAVNNLLGGVLGQTMPAELDISR
ncbi:Glyoxylate reductase/hydroxypyruvate reductase [Grifola frondosa]|uniref:Glyoxylate reductase/hydroxypyruvate reductase n=1 Tax=Grifola frondosa TaxID=5627 RepID=A0A1C7MKI0_GRIFR|nr:Glyoxylate reductase/hydroxypyruvate reductase [Grifola frondosa]